MTETLARVLVSSGDAGEMRELSARLDACGCAAIAAAPGAPALRAVREAHPDLVLASAEEDGGSALALAEGIKRNGDTRHVPVAILVQHADPAFRRACLAAGIDDLVRGPVPDAVLMARLRPLLHLATLAKELERRRETMRGLGLAPAAVTEPEGPEPSVLCVRGRAASAEGSALARALAGYCEVAEVPDVFAAPDMLMDGRYGALVLVPDGDMEAALHFCTHLRNHPRLANFPVVLVADRDSFGDVATPYRCGANLVLTRPFDVAELRDHALSMVQREHRRRAVGKALAATLNERTENPETGLYSRSFFTAHLSRLIAGAGLSQKPLALALYELRNLDWFAQRHGEDAVPKIRREVARAVIALARAEDLPARVGDATIAVALPDTDASEALAVAHRIAGALLNADIAIERPPSGAGLRLWVEAGIAAATAGDTVEGLLQRARDKLR
jgi:two-component system, cell cycle response regulator